MFLTNSRRAGVMKKSFLLYALLAVLLTGMYCPANTPNVDANLQAIVDFSEILGDETPAQFAAHNFRTFFEKNAVPHAIPSDRQQSTESKTHAFQQSFLKYIKEVYNHRSYALRLSQDASHIVQFFEVCNEMNLAADLAYVGIRLFYNKIKACELIDDTVILHVLDKMPTLLDRYFKPSGDASPAKDLAFIQKQTENIILAKFTEHLPEFKEQPDTFITQLSKELATYFQNEYRSQAAQQQENVSKERLRQLIIRFYDTAISKSIWNIKAPEGIWRSFTGIAYGLQLLGNHNIINHMDDLDDLLWTLTHRFCFFLDLTGASLPTTFYEEMEHDLQNKAVYFLEFKEQDAGITSKKEFLIDALIQAKTRAIAFERKGIISMPLLGH
jgi:hypothetical protein